MFNEGLIQNQKDLVADSILYEMLATVKKWRETTDNAEVMKFSTQILHITGYLSSLRLDKLALQDLASQARMDKHRLDEQITKLISND